MKSDICKRIRTIRNNLNMNKNQFAKFLEITPQYLSTIENGKNCLSIDKIILLSEKANISTDYILLGKNEVIDEGFLKDITNLSQEQLDICFSLLKNIVNLAQFNEMPKSSSSALENA